MSDVETRQELLTSAAHHEEELEQALVDLKHAVRPFAIGDRVGQHPVPWLIGAVLIGVWLGSRSG